MALGWPIHSMTIEARAFFPQRTLEIGLDKVDGAD